MQNNSAQNSKRTSLSPRRSRSDSNSNDGSGGTPVNRSYTITQRKFSVTPASMGMESSRITSPPAGQPPPQSRQSIDNSRLSRPQVAPTQQTPPQSRQSVQSRNSLDSSRLIRTQPELIKTAASRLDSPTTSTPSPFRQSDILKTLTMEQLDQLESHFQNMAASHRNSVTKSVTELRGSPPGGDTSSYRPMCFQRRSSSAGKAGISIGAAVSFAPCSAHCSSPAPPIRSNPHPCQNLSSPSTPTNECDTMQATTPADHSFQLQELEKHCGHKLLALNRSGSKSITGAAAEINHELNGIFVKRLREIDDKGQGDTSLKLITYQEWVDMLFKINESILANVEILEEEVGKRLEIVQQRMGPKCRHSQSNELMQCRKDISALIKLIQRAYRYNEWDLQSMSFETLTPAQVLGVTSDNFEMLKYDGQNVSHPETASDDTMQRNKLLAMKALALEVAEKHDEVREFKRQVVCMEEEIQKAQKKIQFKDNVIRELRNDLKRSNKSNNFHQLLDGYVAMPPINLESETARSNNTALFPDDFSSHLESLSQNERLEQQKINQLDEELNEYYDLNRTLSETQRERLSEILQKSESEKIAAYRKLDFIRRQLIDLENSAIATPPSSENAGNDGDSGFSSKNESDQDSKILEAVRKRLRSLNETTWELKNKIQKLEREKTELATDLMATESIKQRNDETLKDVAELLCSTTGKPLFYTDIYKNTGQADMNPFCDAINCMKSIYQQKETLLVQSVDQKNRKIDELMHALINKEKLLSEQHKNRLIFSEGEDIDNITPPASLLLQPQQQSTLLSQQSIQQQSLLLMQQAKDILQNEQQQERQQQ